MDATPHSTIAERSPASPGTELRDWHFTLLLLAGYLGLFHLWRFMEQFAIALSGIAASLLLATLLMAAGRRGYFVNRWDQLFHGLVILDVLLEAILIGHQDGFGFYGCTLGFGLVLGSYRRARLRRGRAASGRRGAIVEHGRGPGAPPQSPGNE